LGLVPKWDGNDFDSIYVVTISRTGDTTKATFALKRQGLNRQGTPVRSDANITPPLRPPLDEVRRETDPQRPFAGYSGEKHAPATGCGLSQEALAYECDINRTYLSGGTGSKPIK
jgi:hypothetical protein